MLSAGWGIKEIPGLTIQQLRPDDNPDGTPSWAIVSELVSSYKYCKRELEHWNDQGMADSVMAEMKKEQLKDIQQKIEDGLPPADQIALAFAEQRFPTREDALQALDSWLLRTGTTL